MLGEGSASEHEADAESTACVWTPGRLMSAKAETPAFSMGFKQDPSAHNTSIKMSTIQSRITQHAQNQADTPSEDKISEN